MLGRYRDLLHLGSGVQFVNPPFRPSGTRESPSGTKGPRRPKFQRKVFMITQSEAKNNPHMITSSLMICNSLTIVLFDYGATHSFIFPSHVKSLAHKVEPLRDEMLINTPLSEEFLVKFVCRNCEIRINYITMKVDFI